MLGNSISVYCGLVFLFLPVSTFSFQFDCELRDLLRECECPWVGVRVGGVPAFLCFTGRTGLNKFPSH